MPRIKTTPPKHDPTRTVETIQPVGFTPEATTYSGIPVVTGTPPGAVRLANTETGEYADLMPGGRIETGVTDRAQVAALGEVANPPPSQIRIDTIPPGPEKTVARAEQVLPSGAKVPSREWVDWCETKIAEQDAALQAIARAVGMVDTGDLAEVVARVRTHAEQSARIAELEAERDAIQHHHDEWMVFRGDADWELAILRRDGRDEDRERITALESELAALRKGPAEAPKPIRPLATWIGNELRTPKGKVIGRVNTAPIWSGRVMWAPIFYLTPDVERLGPQGTPDEARAWVEKMAVAQGWGVEGREE